MNYITARELAKGSKQLWESLAENQELIITNNGKPAALMLDIKDGNPELLLKAIRQAETMMAVNRMRMTAAEHGYMDDEEIEMEIQAARKESGC